MKKKEKFLLRRNQLIVPFGVGAIVNMPNESLMTCGIDMWNDEAAGEKIYDERLQKKLRVSHFRMPASDENYPKGIPFVRFPKWLFCPNKCRSLRPIEVWKEKWVAVNKEMFDVPRCQRDKGTKLVPMRFIIACERGHIDDFPWIEWIHRGETCSMPELTFETGGGTSGLGGIKLGCKTCGAKRTMTGAFNNDAFERIINFKCTGYKPWQNKKETCDLIPRTLQRGASNVYFPKIVSSINIPPFSDDLCTVIKEKAKPEWEVLSTQVGALDSHTRDCLIGIIVKKVQGSKDEISRMVKAMLKFPTGEVSAKSEVEYRYDEFRAFQGEISGKTDSKQFSIEKISGDRYGIEGVKNIILVHRLRELKALIAFSRIRPLDRDELGIDEEEKNIAVSAVSVRENSKIDWFPAVENMGEGVFLTIGLTHLKKWSQNRVIVRRTEMINKNYAEMCSRYNLRLRKFSPNFILLHTLAHLLIRQLSYESGYASASLRERIYCNEEEKTSEMAGILIYTASGDSEGTLGGLVRQGQPDRLPGIIEKAIDRASWCSCDPVCIESEGQGLYSLNLAACYACTLLPETSCEENNKLLDRAMLIGLPEDRKAGFFSFIL